MKLREKGYTELVKAAKSKDAEVARRAELLLQKIREQVPEERLSPPEFDVVQTSDGSRLVGRIEIPALRVRTIAFGDQQLKLADVRSLRSLSYEEPEEVVADALPDPGNMTAFQGQVGKTLAIRVTGRAGGAAPQVAPGGAVVLVAGGTVWGTDIYTRFDVLWRPCIPGCSRQDNRTQVKISAHKLVFRVRSAASEHGVRFLQWGLRSRKSPRVEPPPPAPRLAAQP